jgi:hypothetical protein
VLGCGPWEEPPAFLGSHPLLDEMEEHSARSPAPAPVFGQHPTSSFDLERFVEQVYGPGWT